MSETVRLSNFASIANAVFNSVSANSTAVTAMSVGGHTINATGFPGTANNANNLGGVAAASYQLNSALAANVATMAANSATFANSSATNTFTVGTAAYFVANGNLGIGTSAPSRELSVTGSGVVAGFNSSDNIFAIAISNANTVGGFLGASGNNLLFGTAGASEAMRITTNGDVGIGTSTPGARLDVVTSSPTQARFKAPSGGTAQIVSYPGGCEFSSSDSSVIYGTGAVGGLTAFWAGNAERMRIDASGRVLKPFQPAFHASGDTSISVSISNYTLALPTAVTNRGSHYNTSTFRFTAPVAGMYMFAHRVTWSSTGSGIAVHLSVNGSPFGGAAAYSEVFGYTTGTAYHTTSAAVSFVQLNANDFVDLRTVIYNSSAQSIDLTRSSFSGCLIG